MWKIENFLFFFLTNFENGLRGLKIGDYLRRSVFTRFWQLLQLFLWKHSVFFENCLEMGSSLDNTLTLLYMGMLDPDVLTTWDWLEISVNSETSNIFIQAELHATETIEIQWNPS